MFRMQEGGGSGWFRCQEEVKQKVAAPSQGMTDNEKQQMKKSPHSQRANPISAAIPPAKRDQK
jgi:hypothetical protein